MNIKNTLSFIIPITITGIIIFDDKQKYLNSKYSSKSCALTASTISNVLVQSNDKYNDLIFVTDVCNIIDLCEILKSKNEGFFNIILYSKL